MAETVNISLGIIGILIVSGLGLFLLTPEQLDKARTCTTTNITGIFERFSSTNVTAYWTENTVLKQSVCTKGKWIPTREWLRVNGISEKDITLNPIVESKTTEDNIEIISTNQEIIVDTNKKINIAGQTYNVKYVPKYSIKCICEKTSGCKISECIQ
jgi:hypothetical protein